jgi:hypothetical protein
VCLAVDYFFIFGNTIRVFSASIAVISNRQYLMLFKNLFSDKTLDRALRRIRFERAYRPVARRTA